jgi:hypothetical protein
MAERAETIATAAIMHKGRPYHVDRPGRHHDVIRLLDKLFPGDAPFTGAQGFMTNAGRFVDRYEAAKIATAAGQILPFQNGGLVATRENVERLFSEDMW